MIDENSATSTSDDAVPDETPSSYLSKAAQREAHRLATRPQIDDLVDAVVLDELGRHLLLARPGERLIIERFATILPGRPWLDTKTYTVQSIDEATGRVHLWDDELQRTALTDYIGGTKVGYRFKLPTKGRPLVSNKRKRGRPRKNPPPAAVPAAQDGAPQEKRRRGRPPGAKNRPAEVIAAEKIAASAVRAAQRGRPAKSPPTSPPAPKPTARRSAKMTAKRRPA